MQIVKRYTKLKNEAKLKAFLKIDKRNANTKNTSRNRPSSSSK